MTAPAIRDFPFFLCCGGSLLCLGSDLSSPFLRIVVYNPFIRKHRVLSLPPAPDSIAPHGESGFSCLFGCGFVNGSHNFIVVLPTIVHEGDGVEKLTRFVKLRTWVYGVEVGTWGQSRVSDAPMHTIASASHRGVVVGDSCFWMITFTNNTQGVLALSLKDNNPTFRVLSLSLDLYTQHLRIGLKVFATNHLETLALYGDSHNELWFLSDGDTWVRACHAQLSYNSAIRAFLNNAFDIIIRRPCSYVTSLYYGQNWLCIDVDYSLHKDTNIARSFNYLGVLRESNVLIGEDATLCLDSIISDAGPLVSLASRGFSSSDEVFTRFDTMGLRDYLQRGLSCAGFETPSVVQQRGIVPFCMGHDVILQSRSGCGKTVSFCAGILQQVNYELMQCQALVLAPTAKCAHQIVELMRALGVYLEVKIVAYTRENRVHEGENILGEGVHVIVGTPESVCDMLLGKNILLDHIKMLVLDDADAMLKLDDTMLLLDEGNEFFLGGFKEKVYDIFLELLHKPQVGVSCAAITPGVLEFANNLMSRPLRVRVNKSEELTIKDIKHFYVRVKEFQKLDTLSGRCETLGKSQCVVLVEESWKVEWLASKLDARGFVVSQIHDSMECGVIFNSLLDFYNGGSNLLITTSRNFPEIELENVSLIVNYDCPTDPQNYPQVIIGRSGQFEGIVVTYVTPINEKMLLQNFYHETIEEL